MIRRLHRAHVDLVDGGAGFAYGTSKAAESLNVSCTGAGVTVTAAVAALALPALEVAVTASLVADSSAATTSNPVSLMAVAAFALPETAHVTASLNAPVPETVAENCCVLPCYTETVAGAISTPFTVVASTEARARFAGKLKETHAFLGSVLRTKDSDHFVAI